VPPGLLEHRLIFVTGKGGVGKSTVSLALGIAAARRGLRTIVAEVGGDDRIARSAGAGRGAPFEEVSVLSNLFTISIGPEDAMHEYLRIKGGAFGGALSHSRLFSTFAMATPGMRELLTVGKVWELSQPQRRTRDSEPYDLVIVDSPATGHGRGLLRTPRTFSEIAAVGPIAHQAGAIAATIADRDFTAVVAVATPEEMPVNETLSLHESLLSDDLDLHAVVVNACYPQRFDDNDVRRLRKGLGRGAGRSASSAIGAALSEHDRAEVQRVQRARLDELFDERLLTLPFVFSSSIGMRELEQLAEALAEVLV
jgi:anion-transporting  ArsA/GET3 family ATPase